jgi:hypothetical protein
VGTLDSAMACQSQALEQHKLVSQIADITCDALGAASKSRPPSNNASLLSYHKRHELFAFMLTIKICSQIT